MKGKLLVLALAIELGAIAAQAQDCAFFRGTDPLAQRDEWGLLHQGRTVNSTDFAPRYRWRFEYYFKAPEQLIVQPGYVGAMQTALRRLGYYWPDRRRIFSGSSQCDRASSKELFIARHGHIYRSRAMGTAFALNCL